MKCAKCGTELITRNGKFGEFLACPKSNPTDNHGTVSLRTRKVVVSDYSPSLRPPDLMYEIKKQTIAFGGGLDDMSRLCEWIVDSPADLYDELGNETDHWMNVRPY